MESFIVKAKLHIGLFLFTQFKIDIPFELQKGRIFVIYVSVCITSGRSLVVPPVVGHGKGTCIA